MKTLQGMFNNYNLGIKMGPSMPVRQSLQDPFLNALKKEQIAVAIYLVNGIKLQGQIDSFDQFVILLKSGVSQMVYKHAISTIVPVEILDSIKAQALEANYKRSMNGKHSSTVANEFIEVEEEL